MITKPLIAALVCGLATTPFTAMAEWMSREDIEGELFGVRVSGVIEGTDIRWRECIQIDGETVYEVDGQPPLRGVVTVTDDDLACFSYGGLASCFRVERTNERYAFVDAVDRFLVKEVERAVSQCNVTGSEAIG